MKDYLDHELTKVYNESAYWRRFYIKTSNLEKMQDIDRIQNAVAQMKYRLIPTHVVSY